jgi:hypothetical protein
MRLAVVLCALTVFLSGCGSDGFDPPVPVSGKVTLSGKAVDGATVTFLSKAGLRSASGNTDKDGNFKLTCVNTDDGAPPGDYVVTIAKQESKGGGSASVDISSGSYGADYGARMGAAGTGNMAKVMKEVLPAKFASAAESGLTRSVVKGDKNDFTFDLK